MDQMRQSSECDEFITIIGANMAEINAEFRAQGLADREFSIVHRIGRHRFTRVSSGAAEEMFEGQPMIAATFVRMQR
ncbi:hypothetical protein LMIY3S_02318 [Labrys miyagiensis]